MSNLQPCLLYVSTDNSLANHRWVTVLRRSPTYVSMDHAEKIWILLFLSDVDCGTKKWLKRETHPFICQLGLDKATAEYGYHSFAVVLATRSFLYSVQRRTEGLSLIVALRALLSRLSEGPTSGLT